MVRADFADIDELCSAARGWDLDFRPLGSTATRPCIGRLIQSRSGSIQFAHARFALNLDQRGAPPPGCVTFVVLEEGVRRLWWRGHDVDNRSVLVFPTGGELHSLSGADFSVHTISIAHSLCEEICAALKLGVPSGRARLETFIPPSDVLSSLRRHLRLVAEGTAHAGKFATRSIAEALIKAWAEALVSPKDTYQCRHGPERTMRKALALFSDPDWPTLTVSDLCRHAGVSERTLQNAFRQRFGETPAAFLKARRLAAVNAILKSEGEARASVGDIAAEYGFWHSGQFAADYRRAFGELPSQTLQRATAA